MKCMLWKMLLAAPVVLSASFFASNKAAVAASTVETTAASVVAAEPIQLAQVTSVSELSDVQPGDWAFTALQRLVEEYGCLEGYPDRTFRGNRALTRYEFAAGLNACLDVVLDLISPGTGIEGIARLQEEFAAELATIRGRVDMLEADVAELEANQFSTTTKLFGQLDAKLAVPFSQAEGLEEADATIDYRTRLNFDTSFTGEDRLRIRLQAGDRDSDQRAAFNASGLIGSAATDNDVSLNDVYYSFPVGNRISGIIAANSIETSDFVTSTIVPFDGPALTLPSGPDLYDGFDGGDFAAGVNFAFTNNLVLDLGYSSSTSNINSDTFDDDGITRDGGIFGHGSYIAQLNFLTDGFLDAAVTYIGAVDAAPGERENALGGLIAFNFGRLQVGGHYATVDINGGEDVESYSAGVNLSDFLGVGNALGIYGAVEPVSAASQEDRTVVETYYQIAVNEFFTLTPGIIYADTDTNGDNFYGAVRARIRF